MNALHRRTGRARVQVLLILGVLLLLGGLILVGIVRLRQLAAQQTCGNNLRQLAFGVHNYHSAMDRLPLVDQSQGSATGQGLSSLFWQLIPYLEATHREYRPNESVADAYHAPTSTPFAFRWKTGEAATQDGGDANQVYRAFHCPSDDTASHFRDIPVTLPDNSIGYYATGSYAANGMLPWNKKGITFSSANTILFAERPQVCHTSAGEVVHNLWGVGFYSPHMPAFAKLTPNEPAGLWSTGQVAAVVPLPEQDGEVWVRVGRVNAEPTRPDFAMPVQHIRTGRPCDPRLPGSLHPDGMNAVMGDCSVRVFRYDTSPRVFWSACVPE